MPGIIGCAATKRIALSLSIIILIFTLFIGCGATGNETTELENSEESTLTVPADLLSDELNVFSDIAFPDGYIVYGAGFENNIDSGFYELYLTAEGKPEDIIIYLSNLLGLNTEESIQESIDDFYKTGNVTIFGTQVEDGMNANCDINATKENDYDYDYVPGCTLRLRSPIINLSDYEKIIEDNYNLNSLASVADFFDLMSVTGQSQIYVRKNHNNAQIDVVYNTIDDVAEVMESMKAAIISAHFDENSYLMNLPDYGDVGNNFLFDLENNSISIFQSLADSGKNYKEYKIATNKLTELGFQNFIDKDALCEFKDDANNLSIAINVNQWGSRPDEWENNCVQFIKGINGYLLAIWYYPEEEKYVVQADKDDTSAKFQYYEKTGEISDEWASSGQPKDQFMNMFGNSGQNDVYMQSVEMFKEYVKDTFGMSVDELYVFAASE